MTRRLHSVAIAAVALVAIAAAGSASAPTAEALCLDRVLDGPRVYEPVSNVTAGSVSANPLTAFLRTRCNDTPVAGVTAPLIDVSDPEQVHGVRGVRLQLAGAIPMRIAGASPTRIGTRVMFRLYVRPNVCRSTVNRGTARFLACLRTYNRATAPVSSPVK